MRSEILLRQMEFAGKTDGPRTIWVQSPVVEPPTGLCIFLDGEYYLAQVRAAPIVARMQQEGLLPPMLVAYVSSRVETLARWMDSFCNEGFARYLATELTPWLTQEFNVAAGTNILAGLSLTGIAAAHTALMYPEIFPRVLTLSGSFWWNNCWLVDEVQRRKVRRAAFRLTVGAGETSERVTHKSHGQQLLQRESQVISNRKMRDALQEAGHRVSYHEHPGGHDFHTWRDGLADSLTALMALKLF